MSLIKRCPGINRERVCAALSLCVCVCMYVPQNCCQCKFENKKLSIEKGIILLET